MWYYSRNNRANYTPYFSIYEPDQTHKKRCHLSKPTYNVNKRSLYSFAGVSPKRFADSHLFSTT